MYFTVILIIILTILFGLHYGIEEYFLNKLHMFNIINGIPGPKAFPIIGNAHLFIGDTTALFKQILNLGQNYQLLWRVWIGAKLLVVMEDPEYIKTVLNSPNITDKSEEYEKFKSVVGNGLLTATEIIYGAFPRPKPPRNSKSPVPAPTSAYSRTRGKDGKIHFLKPR